MERNDREAMKGLREGRVPSRRDRSRRWDKPLSRRSLALSSATHLTALGILGAISIAASSAAWAREQRPYVVFAHHAEEPDDWLDRESEPLPSTVISEPQEEVLEEPWELTDGPAKLLEFWDPPVDVLADFELPEETWDVLFKEPVRMQVVPPPVESEPFPEPALLAEMPVDTEPFLLVAPPPSYPALARRRQWEGTVLCRIQVDLDGRVAAASVEESSGYRILDTAAVDAVRNWRFRAGLYEGQAAPMDVLHKVTFRMTAMP